MPYSLTVISHFDAAHYLRDYPGKCYNLHGHRWTVEVAVEGEELNDLGILVDFKDVKRVLKDEVEDYFDHYCLNDLEPFDKVNPTAENLARYIYQSIAVDIDRLGVQLDSVTIWESPECSATYWE